MKKYLFSVLCLMFVAILAPLTLQAKTDKQAEVKYYPEYDQPLSEADRAGAQAIGIGTTTVDLKTIDYKVYKFTAAANQAYFIKSGDFDETDICFTMYAADGEEIIDYVNYFDHVNYNAFIYSDQTKEYYFVVYDNSDYPGTATLEIKDAMFRDNVTQKDKDGTKFGFIPSVSGTYSFTVQEPNYKDVEVDLYAIDSETNVEYEDKKDADYTDTVTAKLEAGKLYVVYVDEAHYKFTLSLTKSPAADAVIDQINKLGAITANSGAAVDAARAAFNALTPAEQKLVSNIGTLAAAEKAYADATRPAVSKGKVKALKATKAKQVLVKWKKVSGANGYQVTYSLKKNFKKAKTVNVSASKAKVTLKKLKSKKVYYVKVRAFKVYRGQTYYGAYSKAKKVKVK